MNYIHGDFLYTFNPEMQNIEVRYLFATQVAQVIGAEANLGGEWFPMGEDHLPGLSWHVVSNNIPGTAILSGRDFPQWTYRYVLFVETIIDGEKHPIFLSDMLMDIDLMEQGVIPAVGFAPEILANLFKLLSTFTGTELPPADALEFYEDVQKNLKNHAHNWGYDARTTFSLIHYVLDIAERHPLP